MASVNKSDIHYCENEWNNIVKKYKLHRKMEIVISEKSSPNDFASESKTGIASPWVLRTAGFLGLALLLGNLPMQSHLTSSTNASISQTSNTHIADIEKDTDVMIANPHDAHTEETLAQTPIETQFIIQPATPVDPVDSFRELSLPQKALQTYVGTITELPSSKWTTYHVKSYDNLTNIFYKLGHQSSLKTLQQSKALKEKLATIKQDAIVRASSDDEGNLAELVFTQNKKDSFVITRNDMGEYYGSWQKNVFEVRQSRASFTIQNGLFFDGKKAGIANKIIRQVVKVFDWDIDFSHDIRVGDKVTAIFEEIYHDGDKVGDQNLLAAEFINNGRAFQTIRYTNSDDKADYYTPQGREMKKAFIRTPIDHARVSSHFNPGRFHPKLHKIRAHKGTDFAARPGTPIMATGNGVITSLGRKGGYGRAIIIKHREGYTTLYAHMSRYNKKLKKGDKVYQGDTIGYVGSSGLATGPHLHYEFRKNKKAINPMTASLPNSLSLSASDLQRFRDNAYSLVLQLNVLHRFVKAKIEINSNIGG